MSKPKVRAVVSVLIGLVIVLVVFVSVQAAASRASMSGERVFTTAGLLPDVKHVRASTGGLNSLDFQTDVYQESGHGCESENYESPDD